MEVEWLMKIMNVVETKNEILIFCIQCKNDKDYALHILNQVSFVKKYKLKIGNSGERQDENRYLDVWASFSRTLRFCKTFQTVPEQLRHQGISKINLGKWVK